MTTILLERQVISQEEIDQELGGDRESGGGTDDQSPSPLFGVSFAGSSWLWEKKGHHAACYSLFNVKIYIHINTFLFFVFLYIIDGQYSASEVRRFSPTLAQASSSLSGIYLQLLWPCGEVYRCVEYANRLARCMS